MKVVGDWSMGAIITQRHHKLKSLRVLTGAFTDHII